MHLSEWNTLMLLHVTCRSFDIAPFYFFPLERVFAWQTALIFPLARSFVFRAPRLFFLRHFCISCFIAVIIINLSSVSAISYLRANLREMRERKKEGKERVMGTSMDIGRKQKNISMLMHAWYLVSSAFKICAQVIYRHLKTSELCAPSDKRSLFYRIPEFPGILGTVLQITWYMYTRSTL